LASTLVYVHGCMLASVSFAVSSKVSSIFMLKTFEFYLAWLCRHRSKTPPPKRKSRFQSRSHSGSPPPQQTVKAEVIPDVVKSCDVSGSETTQKSHVRWTTYHLLSLLLWRQWQLLL